jgi:hypothetical protein
MMAHGTCAGRCAAVFVSCLLTLLPRPCSGQTPSDPSDREVVVGGFLTATVGYPDAVALGGSMGVYAGRLYDFSGVELGASAGVGAVSGRVSWAKYAGTDVIGTVGWSIDAVYVRPWVLKWGVARGGSYVGGGLSARALFSRVSLALLVAPDEPAKPIRPRLLYQVEIPWRW